MKGTRVMRFIGNRSEPEEELYSFEELYANGKSVLNILPFIETFDDIHIRTYAMVLGMSPSAMKKKLAHEN